MGSGHDVQHAIEERGGWAVPYPLLCGQPEHDEPVVLREMAVEAEGRGHTSRVHHGERDRVAEAPILVEMTGQERSGAFLVGGRRADHGAASSKKPLARERAAELAQQQCVRLHLEVVRDEAGPSGMR